MIFLAPLWPIGLHIVWMCCALRAAALRLIGSLTRSDQWRGAVGVVSTAPGGKGTDFGLIKRCFAGWRGWGGRKGFFFAVKHRRAPVGVV